MGKILIGKKIKGVGVATERINSLKPIFRKKIPDIDSFFVGTVNIVLTEKYPTPTAGIILFSKEEIPHDAKYPDESFTFIPVRRINNKIDISCYIVRPEGTCWPECVVEIIAKEDLSKYFPMHIGATIELEVDN
mgnify:CR=1 FL=1